MKLFPMYYAEEVVWLTDKQYEVALHDDHFQAPPPAVKVDDNPDNVDFWAAVSRLRNLPEYRRLDNPNDLPLHST